MKYQRYDAGGGDGTPGDEIVSVFRVQLEAGGALTIETPPVPMTIEQRREIARELRELANAIEMAGDVT